MKKNKLFLFILSVIFMMGFCCQTMAQSGALWLGTKSLPANFYIEVAKGNVPGHSIVHRFGHGEVGTVLAPVSVSLEYKTPSTPVFLEFVSDDADDTAAGDGAREITITGIGEDYAELTQVIATNGLTAVPLPLAMLRVYDWSVSASGVYANPTAGSHEGVLTLRVLSAGATWSTIEFAPFPASKSEIGAYTVPDGFRAYILQHIIDVEGVKAVNMILFKRNNIDTVVAPFEPMTTLAHYVGQTAHGPANFKVPLDALPARTDFGYMANVISSTANVSIHFIVMLVEDGY